LDLIDVRADIPIPEEDYTPERCDSDSSNFKTEPPSSPSQRNTGELTFNYQTGSEKKNKPNTMAKPNFKSKQQRSISTISESSVSNLTGHTDDSMPVKVAVTQPDIASKSRKQKLGNIFKMCENEEPEDRKRKPRTTF
jgi:hypothetical protein